MMKRTGLAGYVCAAAGHAAASNSASHADLREIFTGGLLIRMSLAEHYASTPEAGVGVRFAYGREIRMRREMTPFGRESEKAIAPRTRISRASAISRR
jgi:hypothetical protein